LYALQVFHAGGTHAITEVDSLLVVYLAVHGGGKGRCIVAHWPREKFPDSYTVGQHVCEGNWTYLHISPTHVTAEVTVL
jgi:hypothetical protein